MVCKQTLTDLVSLWKIEPLQMQKLFSRLSKCCSVAKYLRLSQTDVEDVANFMFFFGW